MRHFLYLTAATALWVAVVLLATDKGPYWNYLEDVDRYVRASKNESCRQASGALESTVRACVEIRESAACDRIPVLSAETERCLNHVE